MNKICGYTCKHSKGGVCQITGCDKKIIMTTTTEPQTLTRWQDPTIEEYKQLIKNWKEKYYQMKEERDKYKEIIDKAISYIEENCYDEERKMIINELYDDIPELLDILKGE